jgi:DNA-directed RNA polymerase specialized sigma24 family protein
LLTTTTAAFPTLRFVGPPDEAAHAAIASLPLPYAVALRLHGQGASDETIAAALDVDVEVIGPLLRLAGEKLAAEISRELAY